MHTRKKKDCSNKIVLQIYFSYSLLCRCNLNVLFKQTLNVDYKVTKEEWCQLLYLFTTVLYWLERHQNQNIIVLFLKYMLASSILKHCLVFD